MGATAAIAPGAPTRVPDDEMNVWFSWLVTDATPRPAAQVHLGHTSSVATPPNNDLSATVLATVAHELRGPLTALATSSELLAEDFEILDPDQVRGMLSAIHRRTLWLQGLVENLLAAAT